MMMKKSICFIILIALETATIAASIQNGLLGYYNFDNDYSNTENVEIISDGILYNDPVWGPTGLTLVGISTTSKIGSGSLRIEDADHLYFETNSNLFSDNFTLTYWFDRKEKTIGSYPTISNVSNGNGFAQSIDESSVSTGVYNNGNAAVTESLSYSNTSMAVNGNPDEWYWGGTDMVDWVFAAVVFDRNSNTLYNYTVQQNLPVASTFWEEGVPGYDFVGASPTIVDTTGINLPESTILSIGSDADHSKYFSYFRLDDLGIWDRELTRQELWGIYASGINGLPLTEAVPEPTTIMLFCIGTFLLRRKLPLDR